MPEPQIEPASSALIRLDSSDPQNRWWPAPLRRSTTILRCDAKSRRAALWRDGQVVRQWADPLHALEWLEGQAAAEPRSRWIGFLSYDLGRLFEEVPSVARDDLRLPLFAFAEFREREREASGSRPVLGPLGSAPMRPAEGPAPRGLMLPLPDSTFTRDAYVEAIERAIDYIRAGDVFQVNLSQRFTARLNVDPALIHERLLEHAPARYGGYLDFGDFALVCNSPELFLRVTFDPNTRKRKVITRPIKGTRPRTRGMEAELRSSAKDAAELNMIIDLQRNDLGRVCEIGSVVVAEPRRIEAHPTVYHGVATIQGTLRDDVDFVDLLRATFPGGSITGAPKIRAMQIIDELEPVRRGPYCGAIGYLAGADIELNVAIRTMIVKGRSVHIPVGGGVVADSDPPAEYEETLVKAKAMLDALAGRIDNHFRAT